MTPPPASFDSQLQALIDDATVLKYTASRARLAVDSARPLYHFSPPENYMNDPNGICCEIFADADTVTKFRERVAEREAAAV